MELEFIAAGRIVNTHGVRGEALFSIVPTAFFLFWVKLWVKGSVELKI